jgi:hypothetical protein
MVGSAVSSVVGGIFGARAGDKAADAQQEASGDAIREQQRQFNTSVQNTLPFRTVGNAALFRAAQLAGLGDLGSQFTPNASGELRFNSPQSTLAQAIPQQPGQPAAQQQVAQPQTGFASLLDQALAKARQNQPLDEAEYQQVNLLYGGNVPQGILRAAPVQQPVAQPITQPGVAPQQQAQGQSPEALLQLDPGFNFVRGEGEKAIERAASANGLLKSGRFSKEILRFNQNLAGTEFNNSFNRLTGLATGGLNATQNLNSLGAEAATRIGGAAVDSGNAQAQGILSRNNAIQAGFEGAFGSLAGRAGGGAGGSSAILRPGQVLR